MFASLIRQGYSSRVGQHRGDAAAGGRYAGRPWFGKDGDMAGGWSRDGAVSEQIEASINDELARLKARRAPVGASATRCAECEEPIPEARRVAVPGVKLCIDCVRERDSAYKTRGGINRRGSKDSQLK
jgi:phage/conjugal plasmid C-4 type zinc finger TraR family protein